VLLTLPVVRVSQRHMGAISTFVVASAVQGTTVVLFVDTRATVLAPLLYCVFLLSNSAAAASLAFRRSLVVA